MRAYVVISLDSGRVHTDDHDRLVADLVGRVITGLRDLIDPRGDLPHATPEPLVLETGEGRIDIAADTDPVGLGVPARRPLSSPGRLRWTSAHIACWDAHRISADA